MKNWGNWPEEIHSDPDQVSRIVSATEIKEKEIVEKSPDCIHIQGSGKEPYIATLEDCTCQDFVIRLKKQKPCKHIYRLALENGILELPEPSGPQFEPKKELEKLTEMYLNGGISAKNYAEIGKTLRKLK